MFFLLSVKRGVGGLGQSKKFLSGNTRIFFTYPKGFIRLFGIICQKKWGFYIKNGVFLTIFLTQSKRVLSDVLA